MITTIIGIGGGLLVGLIAFVVYVRVSTNIEKKKAIKKREELKNSKRLER